MLDVVLTCVGPPEDGRSKTPPRGSRALYDELSGCRAVRTDRCAKRHVRRSPNLRGPTATQGGAAW